jgi:hypothetical protein
MAEGIMAKYKETPPSIARRIIAALASVVAVIAVMAGLVGNVKTIADGVNSVFGLDFSAKVMKVCMGNGGGANCLSGADAKFDCDHYKAMGGGGEPQTQTALATQFCPSKRGTITVYQDNTGGECGWTGFELTCKRLWWPF